MTTILIVILAVGLLLGLIRAETSEQPWRILCFKTPLSLLFIAVWFLQRHPNVPYAALILIGLICCLAGDVLLAFDSPRPFLMGLVSFLLGHIAYSAAFFAVGGLGPWMASGVLFVMAAGGSIWRWLSPHLDDMAMPVLAYIVVISIMVCGAWSIAGISIIPSSTRAGIVGGAALFYLSDICVARQRFIKKAHVNRLAGLPLYYAAQFLLSFTSGGVPA